MNRLESPTALRTGVLTENQRRFYRENGYLILERIIPDDWLGRLRAAARGITADTARLSASTRKVALRPDHSAETPKPAWVWNPDEDSDVLWSFLSDSVSGEDLAKLCRRQWSHERV